MLGLEQDGCIQRVVGIVPHPVRVWSPAVCRFDFGGRTLTIHSSVHAQKPTFTECSLSYINLKVCVLNPHWLNQLPSGQPTNSCSCPQRSMPALQQSTLVKLYEQATYITSWVSGRKRALIIIVRPSGQLLAVTVIPHFCF